MTHTETRSETETWEVEVCDNCGHDVDYHNDNPTGISYTNNGPIIYIAMGCMVVVDGGRKIDGNPHPRCTCLHSV